MDEKEMSSALNAVNKSTNDEENNEKTQTIDQVLSDCTIESKEDLGECSSNMNSKSEKALEATSESEINETASKTAQEERYLALRTRYTEKQLSDFRTEADKTNPKASSSEIDDSSTQMEQKSDTPTATTTAGPSKPRKTKYSTRNYRSHNSRCSTSSDASSEDSTAPDNNVSVRKREKRARTTSRNAEPVTKSSSSSSESEDNNIEQPGEMGATTSGSSSGDDSLICSTSSLFTDEHQSTEDSDEGSGGDDTTVQKIKSSKILSKIKPKYTWKAIPEIYYRELGLSGKGRRSFRIMNGINFQNRLCGSLHPIERLELMYKLSMHEGCVNSLNFNRSGSLLVSGSDDLKIIIWKWASNSIAYSFNSGHTSNVFQTKFLHLDNQINIVSSARDGQIRYAVIPPSGIRDPISTVVIKHLGAVHKIALTPNNPYEVLTAGEDGHVIRCDLRDNSADRLVTVRVKNKRVPLYSIASHPIDQEFCVSGRDQFVRIYDRRNCKETLKAMAPAHLIDRKPFITHITCAVYNYTGSEILASYSDEDIYLFDNQNYSHGSYLHKYQGHNNSSTIKGVNFFGPQSEFIMSGSDCANCFFWDKNTEAIVQWIAADENGVVNCLEPHPQFPMLATSGLDHDIKIWVPSHEKPSIMEGLKRCIQRNISCRNSAIIGVDLFDDRTMNIFVRQCLRNRNRGVNDQSYPNIADIVSSDEDDDPFTRMDHDSLPCSPS